MTKTYRKKASYCISEKKKTLGMSTDPTHSIGHTHSSTTTENPLRLKNFSRKMLGCRKFQGALTTSCYLKSVSVNTPQLSADWLKPGWVLDLLPPKVLSAARCKHWVEKTVR